VAKAITTIEESEVLQSDTRTEAVEAGIQLLTALHEKGMLAAGTAAIQQSDALLEILVEAVNQPGATSGMKTFIALAQGMAQVDASLVSGVLQGLTSGTKEVQAGEGVEVQGVWDLLKTLRDPDVAKGISTLLTIVKHVGAALQPRSETSS
jgi:uncharacterized protein YjgD (DUF1641 family)